MTENDIPATSVFIDGTEELGFILYGLWTGVVESTMRLDGGELDLGDGLFRPFRLFGDGWTILGCDVGFRNPNAYRLGMAHVERVFDRILLKGASVAWMGYEGLPFADPPELFTIEWMEGGVVAAKGCDGVFLSGLDPLGGHAVLGSLEMGHLERLARSSYGA